MFDPFPSSNFVKTIREQEEKSKKSIDKRLKWDKSIMKCLEEFETHSHCVAKHVCCIIVREDSNYNYNILSIGINGTPSGLPNCDEIWKKSDGIWVDKKTNSYVPQDAHSKWSAINEIHAEVNAVSKCNKNNISTEGSYAFISYSPCMHCAKLLVASGIKRIVFREKYDDYEQVSKFLVNNNIEVVQYYKKD